MIEGFSRSALARCVRDVAEFLNDEGWGQPPQLYALVPTEDLVAAEPSLLDELSDGAVLTPIAQEALPSDIDGGSPALDEFLATTSWPEAVAGCLLAQEIVVLPPDAEADLDDALGPLLSDRDAADAAARDAAHAHPGRRSARLFAAALRDGTTLSMLQLKPQDDDEDEIELRTYPDLATNVLDALYATLD
nr:PPA1309 family protein [Skermania sp. ID1734]